MIEHLSLIFGILGSVLGGMAFLMTLSIDGRDEKRKKERENEHRRNFEYISHHTIGQFVNIRESYVRCINCQNNGEEEVNEMPYKTFHLLPNYQNTQNLVLMLVSYYDASVLTSIENKRYRIHQLIEQPSHRVVDNDIKMIQELIDDLMKIHKENKFGDINFQVVGGGYVLTHSFSEK